jgi:hypothetical protein
VLHYLQIEEWGGGMNVKRFGIVHPSELFLTKKQAIDYAKKSLLEDDLEEGILVFETTNLTHYKARKIVDEVPHEL